LASPGLRDPPSQGYGATRGFGVAGIAIDPQSRDYGVTDTAKGRRDANCRLGSLVHWCNDGTAMRYYLEIKEEARQQLRALAKEQRRNVGRRLDALQNNLSGDVKKLAAKTHEYRLRVGDLRVLLHWKRT
jgi:mRNA interferase RelE/StbE